MAKQKDRLDRELDLLISSGKIRRLIDNEIIPKIPKMLGILVVEYYPNDAVEWWTAGIGLADANWALDEAKHDLKHNGLPSYD